MLLPQDRDERAELAIAIGAMLLLHRRAEGGPDGRVSRSIEVYRTKQPWGKVARREALRGTLPRCSPSGWKDQGWRRSYDSR